ncbi:hypothetical protein PAL_GLEAN10012703 [Pteropus alecto]|uniref:Uncharacterized protein n=1 Tax=Pteropus alecto TaxID=9402 RepID=L5K7C8_PTEAL|nr:hypothetical protein PAL_GLEAN10012703 [Pteropus alecto]
MKRCPQASSRPRGSSSPPFPARPWAHIPRVLWRTHATSLSRRQSAQGSEAVLTLLHCPKWARNHRKWRQKVSSRQSHGPQGFHDLRGLLQPMAPKASTTYVGSSRGDATPRVTPRKATPISPLLASPRVLCTLGLAQGLDDPSNSWTTSSLQALVAQMCKRQKGPH